MAFDFLGNIFGKKKVDEKASAASQDKEKHHLKSENMLGWLNSQLSDEIKRQRKQYSSMSEELVGLVRDLRRIVDSMRQKSFEAGDNTYAAVNMIKDTWTKKALMSFNSYNRDIRAERISPDRIDFPAFSDIYHSTTRLMNDMTMIPRQKLVLRRYFEKESKKMSDVLGSIATIMESMKTSVSGSGPLKSINRVREMLDQLDGMAKESERLENDIDAASAGVSAKENEIRQLSERISSMGKSPAWKELAALDRSIKDSLDRKDDIEADISDKLSSMKRVFKLYAHDAHDLGKDEKKALLDLSHSPLKTFLSRDSGSISAAMARLGRDIEAGSFSLSKKDSGKTGELKHILDTGWVEKARSEHDKSQADAAAYRARREGIKVMVEMREAERMLEKGKANLDMQRRQESELKRKLKEKMVGMKEKKAEISDFVRKELGSEVELD